MRKNEPVDPRVRLAIARWPDDAPRGAVSTFCAEHGISRKTFYLLRHRAQVDGPAAVLEPRSRRPHTSPRQLTETAKQHALDVRAALERSGLDHGPISVHDRMQAMGLTTPSIAALARVFREAGVARQEPRKKPRAAYRRFVYPAPNACWQLDATEYALATGQKCVIFQLQDDHSRTAVASLVATGETAEAAVAVFQHGVRMRGLPQRLLTDNGVALNPSRRGATGQLVTYATSLGVEMITGKPYKPTTQGKNERFHQTLFRWLDKQPHARSIAELQTQVDQFDRVYNLERPHQGLPGRVTPQAAWDATPVAEPPKPRPPLDEVGVPSSRKELKTLDPVTGRRGRILERGLVEDGERVMSIQHNGTIQLRYVRFQVTSRLAGQLVYVVWDRESVVVSRLNGDVIVEHSWPAEGVLYVSNGMPRGKVPRGEVSPMS